MMAKWAKAWLFFLAVLYGCAGLFEPAPPEPGTVPWALTFLRSLGDAALRVDGTAAILRYAPEAMPLVDVGVPDGEGGWVGAGDGVVTLAELEQVVGSAQDPEQVAWLVTVVYAMMRER